MEQRFGQPMRLIEGQGAEEPKRRGFLAFAERIFSGRVTAFAGILLLVVIGAAWGISLDRYPLFYVDDSFFNFPAIRAAHGGQLQYRVSREAPFAEQVWAYHGPLYPNLQAVILRVLGTNQATTRLADFLAGWLAILLLTIFLMRRGYRFAPLIFAVFWVGDRATQELMYGRMDGLALLCLAGGFVFTERAWRLTSRRDAFIAGALLGLACAFHPLVIAFAAAGAALLVFRLRWWGLLAVVAGGCLAIPLVLFCWHFEIRDAMAQFFWHAHLHRSDSVSQAFVLLISVLRWSRYWFLALAVFTVLFLLPRACWEAFRLKIATGQERRFHLILVTFFALAGLSCLFRTAVHPYYLIFFTVWPMMGIAMLAEVHGRRSLPWLAVAFVVWSSSCAWNVLRLRESVIYHRQLSHEFMVQLIQRDVPQGATIVTTPELYVLPVEAGYKLQVTNWFAEQDAVCSACYLLMEEKEYEHPTYVAAKEVSARKVLYAGPAFPAAGPMQYPLVLLSSAE